jgi:hypothetical protein
MRAARRVGELPVSPRPTFEEVARPWLADFEAKVAAGERRERTLDLYRSQLHRHLLPRLRRRRLALIGPDDVVTVMRELQTDGLSPRTVMGILGTLSCVSASHFAAATSARTRSTGSQRTSGRIRSPLNSACSARTSSSAC